MMKTYFNIFVLLFFALLVKGQDKEISAQLSLQLAVETKAINLHYPGSVKRFYAENGFQPTWIRPDEDKGKALEAMFLLDCVLQFGLFPEDFHPYELSSDSLHIMFEEPGKLGTYITARFDIVLTDAMITFMNHLHYGKLNPQYTSERIDQMKDIPFLAGKRLKEALHKSDFTADVLDVQPKAKLYQDLQEYMRLAQGQYIGDCYDVPEADIRCAAINMERLRWADFASSPYIHINIPSYTLDLYEPDSIYSFKVNVEKLKAPRLSSSNAVVYFTTSPDSLKLSFPNSFDVYLDESPNPKLFDKADRFSNHGRIKVQNATMLAALLLLYNGAGDPIDVIGRNAERYLKENFKLKDAVSIKVTYLTCGIKDADLVIYKDIYHLDEPLENKLYHTINATYD